MKFTKMVGLKIEKCHFLVLVILASLLSYLFILMFYPEGVFITGYDGLFHFRRFMSIADAIQFGSFPFYIDSYSLGYYGYATNLFYPDFFLVPFAFLSQYFGAVFSYKFMIFCSSLSCSCVAYWSLYKIQKDRVLAIIFSLLYTFSLYRIADMSMRGSLGELWAFTFLPLICWGMYEVLYGNFKNKWYALSLGFAGLMLSHMLSSVIVFFLILVFLVVQYKVILKEPKRLLYLVIAGFCTLLLSATFLFPFLEQLSSGSFYYQTNPVIDVISGHTRSLNRVFTGLFKGFSTRDELDFPMMDVGLLLLFPLLFRFFVKEKSKLIKSADFSMLAGVILLFVISDFFPWTLADDTKIASLIQYPWRLLFVISLLFSYSGAVYLRASIKGNQWCALCFILFVLILVQMRFTGIAFQETRWFKEIPDVYITQDKVDKLNTYTSVAGAEYLPSKVVSIDYIIQHNNKITSLATNQPIDIQFKKDKGVLSFFVATADSLSIPLLYYKGYKATLNGEELSIRQSEQGLVEVDIPNSGYVDVWFAGTTIQKASFFISMLSFFLLLIYIGVCNRKVKKLQI